MSSHRSFYFSHVLKQETMCNALQRIGPRKRLGVKDYSLNERWQLADLIRERRLYVRQHALRRPMYEDMTERKRWPLAQILNKRRQLRAGKARQREPSWQTSSSSDALRPSRDPTTTIPRSPRP